MMYQNIKLSDNGQERVKNKSKQKEQYNIRNNRKEGRSSTKFKGKTLILRV